MWSPKTSHQAAFLVEVGKANIYSLLISVLGHLSQLGCQVDSNVFIQGVVCDVCKVVQVVEAVQPLSLFGLPQQSIPVDVESRGGSEHGANLLTTEDGAGQTTAGDTTQGSPFRHMARGWPFYSMRNVVIIRNTSYFMPGTLLITLFHLMHLPLKQMRKPRLMMLNDLPKVTEWRGGKILKIHQMGKCSRTQSPLTPMKTEFMHEN